MNQDRMIEIIEKGISLIKKQADWGDIYFSNSIIKEVSFEENKLKKIELSETGGIGVRLIKNGKMGFSSDSNPENIDKIVSTALEYSKFGQSIDIEFSDFNYSRFDKDLLLYEKHIDKYDFMIERGEFYIDKIKKIDVSVEAEISTYEKNVILGNTSGFMDFYKKSSYSETAVGIIVQESGFLYIYDFETEVRQEDIKPNKIIESINLSIDSIKKERKLSTGRYSVLFTPKAVKTLISLLLQPLNAKILEKGISFLSDKIGHKIVNSSISIIDDPNLYSRIGSYYFDGEGMLGKEKYLIKKGVLNSFYSDIFSGEKTGIGTTGNAARGYSTLPYPALSNIVLESGDEDFSVIEGREYILIDQFIGAGQSNILSGEFTASLDLAFFCNGSERKARVKNIMMAGNLFDILSNAIPLKQKRRYGSYTVPYIFAENISLASTN